MSAREGLYGENYDFPPGTPLKGVIALCFGPRTGSNHLATAMWRTGCLGAPMEYFNYDSHAFGLAAAFSVNNLPDYVDALIRVRTSPNGVFSTKLLPGHWMMLNHSRRRDLVTAAGLVIVYRRDIVAQAVSLVMAEQSGMWRSDFKPIGMTAYDYSTVLQALRYLESINAFWYDLPHVIGRKAVLFAYEDFAAVPDQAAARIASVFGISIDQGAAVTNVASPEQQFTDKNAEWIERFRADMARAGEAIAPSPFAAVRSKS